MHFTFIIFTQWMYMIFSLLVITKIRSGLPTFSIVAMMVAMDTRKYSFNYIFNISQHKNTKVCVLDNSTILIVYMSICPLGPLSYKRDVRSLAHSQVYLKLHHFLPSDVIRRKTNGVNNLGRKMALSPFSVGWRQNLLSWCVNTCGGVGPGSSCLGSKSQKGP